MAIETYHIPVMLDECISALNIKPNGIYVDLTMGGGGHTREILKHLGPEGHLYSLDQDPDAEANAPQDPRHTFVASNFRFVRGALRLRGVEHVDGILADLGVSSHHFDAKHRGFSFRGEALLDMRMNTRGGRTAADIINTYTNDALAKIFSEYGELDTTWKIANCIERARTEKPITTTAELVEAVKPCTPPKDEAKFLTKLFQAIRIELNGEIEALKMALEQSAKLLSPEGRLVVMSYHSLEDRLVKNFMRSGNCEGVIEKDFFGRATTPFKVISRKAIVPSDEEITTNPRSRSAKLRVAEKLAE
ncbi:MAG: 16S rRNA (cytosine(1402)-N(4))-methyltransferase RsmH [Alistipes sp.]|jgi:16S rRNA (cytosine1402-N4)-methyltransferase|nr:16S rRNA (cytosine(1402)-N(4))-methyltransferase RsmH [Alistipes sp.]